MRVRRKHIRTNTGKPPALVRVLEEFIAASKAGFQNAELDKALKALIGNKKEVAAARLWLADEERILIWLEFKSRTIQALRRESNRKDLTISEGMRLWRALNENARVYDDSMPEGNERRSGTKHYP